MRKKIPLPFALFTLLVGCSWLSSGCDDSDPSRPGLDAAADHVDVMPVAAKCSYNGRLYDDQTGFPAGDGCNTCFCNPGGTTPGQVGCTIKACDGLLDAGGDAADAQADAR